MSSKSYLRLVKRFPLISIKTQQQLKEATEVIQGLLRKNKLDKGETEYLEVLSDLISSYEDKICHFKPSSDSGMLQHLMDAKGVNQLQLAAETKISRSTISEILTGKRRFSRNVIVRLAAYFKVSPTVLASCGWEE